jgi:endonuclease/exonuclease/phosphatase family metal-dependent hydrolase
VLTVASYNIRKSVGLDWRRQPDRILEVIREVDADIVALQEVDRRFGSRTSSLSVERIVAGTPYFPVRFGARPTSLGWHGNTILVRKGANVLAHKQIHLPQLEPRGAVMADIEIGGLVVRVIGMHLGLVGLWRKQQALAVLQLLEALEEKLPTVMMGDLNQWTTEGGALAQFAKTHNVVAPGPSFHASRPVLPLDRIITDLDFIVESAGVHLSPQAQMASDHLPVWAKLALNPLSPFAKSS